MNIPFNITEQDVRHTFSKFGEINAIDFPL